MSWEQASNILRAVQVRAAMPGMPVSEQNCHPFQWGRYMWMHNGMVSIPETSQHYPDFADGGSCVADNIRSQASYIADDIQLLSTYKTDASTGAAAFKP